MPKKEKTDWLGKDSALVRAVESTSQNQFNAYLAHPPLVKEHANLERAMVEGGYGRKQIYELVQNGADEMLKSGGRIEVVLTKDALFCANDGDPMSEQGAVTILGSHVSSKRGSEIGRFGLGFKSVLGITTTPQVFSQSGSFEFELEANRALITDALPEIDRIPILRLASGIDPSEWARTDSVLAELMEWAATVIRLPRNLAESKWLNQDIRDFPAEFLVFSSHVNVMTLDDREEGFRRELTINEGGGGWLHLGESGKDQRWKVASSIVNPSTEARKDGGYAADRDEVPVHWAVVGASRGLGGLWAFFPTKDETTLRGVVNAPWKLSEDRTVLLEGAFNDDLLENVASMVLDALPDVASPDDPGEVLDIIPARGREVRSWADGRIGHHLYEMAPGRPILPDQNGELCLPGELTLHPTDLPESSLIEWSKHYAGDRLWCHHSVDSHNRRERRPRAERLIKSGDGKVASVAEWLKALLDKKYVVESSREAVLVASAALGSSEYANEIREVPIIVLTDGETLVSASAPDVFIPSDDDPEVDVRTVHRDLLTDPATLEALKSLGVPVVSASTVLRARLRNDQLRQPGSDWSHVWELARNVPTETAMQLFEEAGLDATTISVRTAAGGWRPVASSLLPGRVLDPKNLDEDDLACLIDLDWHGSEETLFKSLGASSGPVERRGSNSEPWFEEYEKEMIDGFIAGLQSKQVKRASIEISGIGSFAGPLTPIQWLSPEGQARFLAIAYGNSEDTTRVTIAHRTNAKIPSRKIPHPITWFALRAGVIATTDGVKPISESVGAGIGVVGNYLPKAVLSESAARALGLPDRPEDLGELHWAECLENVSQEDLATRRVEVYRIACQVTPAPSRLAANGGEGIILAPPSEIALAAKPEDIDILRKDGIPYLPIESESDQELLHASWGLVSSDEMIRSEISAVPSDEPTPLGDLFQALRPLLAPDQRTLKVTNCSDLSVDRFTDAGRTKRPEAFVLQGSTIFRLESLDDEGFLTRLSAKLGLELTAQDIDDLLETEEVQATVELTKKMRAADSDGERLLMVIDASTLLQRMPSELRLMFDRQAEDVKDHEIADAFLGAYGLESLIELRQVLQASGLPAVPDSWAGSRAAIKFVESIGFGRAYAGFKDDGDRAPVLEIEGPLPLPPLHDFQEVAGKAINAVIESDVPGRGLLSLPTGAGKTRVTVEAFIDSIREGRVGSPVLWIAQSDELCEQAVQSWAEVWRSVGPPRPLQISRLWSKNSATGLEHGNQVVVATPDKLVASCVGSNDYEWLADAAAVVIDEAHLSTTSKYTEVLDWLGLTARQTSRPLIGLSATPFRGVSKEETERLASRYGKNRLDKNAFTAEPTVEFLQERGTLAKVRHEILTGAEIDVTDDELSQLNKMRSISPRLLSRIGADIERNERLVDSIAELDPDWSTLVFCASVSHAQTIASLVQRRKKTAAAIYGGTKQANRRYLIEQFKSGEIRVLTNCDLLTQGFDAPKIRALYIARPTYSPNRYQQMIGRGLRGPENKGEEECLVVNIDDNFKRYGEDLAFRDFEYLWNR